MATLYNKSAPIDQDPSHLAGMDPKHRTLPTALCALAIATAGCAASEPEPLRLDPGGAEVHSLVHVDRVGHAPGRHASTGVPVLVGSVPDPSGVAVQKIMLADRRDGDRLGQDVELAGDVAGDGFDDVIIASRRNAAYVFFGSPTGLDTLREESRTSTSTPEPRFSSSSANSPSSARSRR